MARRYVRDRLGRFAPKGFSGQTSGRGARLMAPGKSRKGGGSKIKASRVAGTIGKRRGMKPDPNAGRPKKGLKASGRTRAQAFAAQRSRARGTIEATRGQLIGYQRGVTATAGGGEKISIKRARSNQANIFGGFDKVTTAKVSRVALKKGTAPGSKRSRMDAGRQLRSSETDMQRARRIFNRVSTIENRRSANPGNYATKRRRDAQSMATQAAAYKFMMSAGNMAGKHGGIMNAIRAAKPAPKPKRQKRRPRR